MENPFKMDDLGSSFPYIFGSTPTLIQIQNPHLVVRAGRYQALGLDPAWPR